MLSFIISNRNENRAIIAVLPLIFAFLSITSLTSASPAPPDPLKVVSIKTPPKIDGFIDAEEWKAAVKAELNYQVYPNTEDTPASERTEAYLMYDREHLYIAFHAFDSNPAAIRAPVSKRDSIDADDYVTLFLDTYDDKQRAYYFSINAQGVQQDGIYTEAAGSDVKWDGIFESKGKTTNDGYVVEIAIPFKSLRFKAGKEAHWGLHFRRWIARKSERTSWQRLSRNNDSLLSQAGTITGLEDVFTGSSIDIIPTIAVSNTGTREINPIDPLTGKLHGVNKLDPGLTVIYSISPNATLSATINPDFSQVEADVPQVSVNQRFPLFFPEKRPFFLEGSEFFNATSTQGFRFLDTRQIVDPDWGIKFTGKFGRNTLSYLAASDNSAGLRLAPIDPSFAKNALFNVFRYQRDILKDSAIGVFMTDRRFAGGSNTVVAAESRLKIQKVNTVGAQFVWTKTKTLNGQTLNAYAHNLRLVHFSRNWHIYLRNEYVQPNYRSEPGFISRTNYHEYNADIGYEWRPKEKSGLSKVLVYVWPYLVIGRSRTITNNRPELNYTNLSVEALFKRGIEVNYYRSSNHEGFAGGVFDFTNHFASWSVNTFKRISFSGNFIFGEGINYDPANAVVGKRFSTRQTVTLRPTSRLNSEFLYLKSQLSNKTTGALFFTQDILRNRTIYQFNQCNAFRSIVEYDTSARRLGLSFLYSYTPRPNTSVYVGYSDLLYSNFDPLFRTPATGLVRQSRSVFAKFSYNLRF